MPHHPAHPPFLFSLNKKHGDYVGPGGVGSASESLALGGHVGTHLDALCHFSCGGNLHGGTLPPCIEHLMAAALAPSRSIPSIPSCAAACCWTSRRFTAISPCPRMLEGDARECSIVPADAIGVNVERGDVVLLRTGWAQFWEDAPRFISEVRGPGPSLSAPGG